MRNICNVIYVIYNICMYILYICIYYIYVRIMCIYFLYNWLEVTHNTQSAQIPQK